MAIEDGMDGAFCREADITGQAAQEELPDLAGAPVRFVAFEADDEALELGGEALAPPGCRCRRRKVLPMCPVRSVTCVSGRSKAGPGRHFLAQAALECGRPAAAARLVF